MIQLLGALLGLSAIAATQHGIDKKKKKDAKKKQKKIPEARKIEKLSKAESRKRAQAVIDRTLALEKKK